MIAPMTKKKRMLRRVREYMSGLGGLLDRERHGEITTRLLDQVGLYVAELEQVVEGIESHSVVMRVLRQECMISLGEVEAHAQRYGDYGLDVYVQAARAYVEALESWHAGEETDEIALHDLRRRYESTRRSVDERNSRD
jgi:hypothetical protein